MTVPVIMFEFFVVGAEGDHNNGTSFIELGDQKLRGKLKINLSGRPF